MSIILRRRSTSARVIGLFSNPSASITRSVRASRSQARNPVKTCRVPLRVLMGAHMSDVRTRSARLLQKRSQKRHGFALARFLTVSDALEARTSSSSRKGLSLRFAIPVEPIRIFCDRQRTLQVLANLLGNAIKFTPDEGAIALVVHSDEHETIALALPESPSGQT